MSTPRTIADRVTSEIKNKYEEGKIPIAFPFIGETFTYARVGDTLPHQKGKTSPHKESLATTSGFYILLPCDLSSKPQPHQWMHIGPTEHFNIYLESRIKNLPESERKTLGAHQMSPVPRKHPNKPPRDLQFELA